MRNNKYNQTEYCKLCKKTFLGQGFGRHLKMHNDVVEKWNRFHFNETTSKPNNNFFFLPINPRKND